MLALLLWLAFYGKPAFVVDFGTPVVRRVPIEQKERLCATSSVIEGCTAFREEVLRCDCEEVPGGWRMSFVARSATTIYLFNSSRRTYQHELLHIEDIRGELGRFLSTASSRVFESHSDCLLAADYARDLFPRQMNALRAQSQERYR